MFYINYAPFYKDKIDVKHSLEHEMNDHNTKIYSELIKTLKR